ncbi:beta-galactosidase [Actinoplanes lobatus]|uniref:Beta-galactosidase n=1 Tax=Actinoplanes lobatus TaxID=113568 RepID=A0A7W7HE58_9ACTN|nr:beta-galactosidase [Actinoplanes lobatus]MBB4748859.1 beta-galactosidase [Actinoplanes lobatus]GGN67735.1 beta-galactosidase [Actinoplanes lobatus]GIE37233.1 beta-galactosidase [Actinoplanes lobatus]
MLFFGGDYNPEQWPEEVWAEDVALMRQAGVNIATVGVFSWSNLEPEPGRYEFGWLDRVLDRLHDGGVRVALATPTASPPPWFTLAHPEAMPAGADGIRLTHGSRDTYCVSAPAYRAAARNIAERLAERYAHHPALAMWHVHNEYGTDCRCDTTAAAFRTWLEKRHGDLDALNESWTTAFWSQRYSDWAQITPPRATQYLPNPAQVLDFRRFLSDELLGAYVEQRDLLRAANPDVPVTTNFVQGGWVSVDHARWAAEVDVVAVDHYPDDAGPGAEEETAFAGDLARGWGGGSWLLMETAPNLIYTRGRMHAKEPGRLTRHSLGYVARGSRGAMYFQWRQPRGGAELFHSALVPHAGPDSPVFREAVGLGRTLRGLAPVASALPPVAQVALTWDAPSWWALQAPALPSADIDYPGAVRQAHRALFRAKIQTDFVFPGMSTGLGGYRLVVAPHLYLVSDEAAAAFRDYVAAGGHLVVTYLSGIAEPDTRVRLGGYPGAFREVLGVRVVEWHPQPADRTFALDDGTPVSRWIERVETAGAETISRYADGPLAGAPAITRHRYGQGAAWYVSTSFGDDGLRALLTRIAAEAGVEPVLPGLPDQVEAVRRGDLMFLFNHGITPARVGEVTIPAGGVRFTPAR